MAGLARHSFLHASLGASVTAFRSRGWAKIDSNTPITAIFRGYLVSDPKDPLARMKVCLGSASRAKRHFREVPCANVGTNSTCR